MFPADLGARGGDVDEALLDVLVPTFASGTSTPPACHSLERRGPQWWWPDDRGWFLGSEIVHPRSYLAGTTDLIDAVHAVSEASLLLTCGLPGAGKTGLARRLAADRRALRLTKDEWLWALGTSPWDESANEKMERELWRVAQELLRLGVSVVLDFGLWSRAERDEIRQAARELRVRVELHALEAPLDELWRRIQARNAESPWDAAPITRAHLVEWAALFQAPDAAELALFDAPPQD